MYPVRLGYGAAKKRINKLINNGHYAESLVTSVFTAEKTIRRTLKQLIISAGFKSDISKLIIRKIRGIHSLIEAWEIYEPQHRKLSEVVSKSDIQTIERAAEKRNKLVHGERVYGLDVCKNETKKVLEALDRIKTKFEQSYGYSGWTKISIRKKSKLHIDPKVKMM
jgi:uncharacterized protein YutE (UPF0331/DUF86 family)